MKTPAPFYIGIAKDEKRREEFLTRGNLDQKRKVQEAMDWLKFRETGQMPASPNRDKSARPKTEAKISRNDLMLQAKEKGIKNFRVLNKEELEKVLDPKATKEDIDKVIQSAVKRWKSGWGSRSK